VHETEDGMNLIVVQVQTLALTIADLQLLGLVVFVDGEGHTGINAAEHTDQAAADAVAASDVTGDVFFGGLGRVEIADFTAQLLRLAQAGLFEAGGPLLTMGGKVLKGNAAGPKIALQPAGVGDVTQGAAKEEAVKAIEDAADDGSEFL
jgi:hypothetical protein